MVSATVGMDPKIRILHTGACFFKFIVIIGIGFSVLIIFASLYRMPTNRPGNPLDTI
jgi:hypothetical protein